MKIKELLREIVKFKFLGKKEWNNLTSTSLCPKCNNNANIVYQNNIHEISCPRWWYCKLCRVWGKFKKKKYEKVKSYEELL